ncbi:hypothetical protein H7J83_21635 [Mycobacterium mantenii]|nr:hypothetical protein [Mycobacterium mantenii]MCV7245297.1 hypothetical protein [Mycobacterium mantenii]
MSYSQLPDLECCGGDDDCLLHRLRIILEKATGVSGQLYPGGQIFPSGRALAPGAGVRFPSQQFVTVERVCMWVDSGDVCLAMWPGELQPQYRRVYSDPKAVEALIALTHAAGWEVHPNFHLAYRFASPQQRWYPPRYLPGPAYLRQWIDDLHDGRAGGRTRDQLADPSFREWLVQRAYADDADLASLDVWINEQSPKRQFHIRPSVQIQRTWPMAEAIGLDREGVFIAEVRGVINQIFGALGEQRLPTSESLSDAR